MKKCSVFFIAISLFAIQTNGQSSFLYKNPRLPVSVRVADLLKRMSPEEKFWQLFMIPGELNLADSAKYRHGLFGFQVSAGGRGDVGGQLLNYDTKDNALVLAKKINGIQKLLVEKSRLGVPMIAFDEALHGLVREGATVFPQSIALAASWDTTLMANVAKAIATETKIRGIRQILSPVVNIASDSRWGRTEETYGEDPFLVSSMAVAFVKSFEEMGIVTTPKHLILNVGDGGRDSYPIHVNKRLMEEIYLVPFKACFEKGGSRSVMTAYNSLDGVACSANSWLLQRKLKKELGFRGFVISDANAVGGEVVLHHTAADYATSGEHAINNGLDVIFQTDYNHYKLFNAPFLDGRIERERLNDAVARVLKVKFELGLFEDPYVNEKDPRLSTPAMHKSLAKQAALESVVLLKNLDHVLPITKKLESITVVGEDAAFARMGGYSGPGVDKQTILESIKKKCGATVQVNYSPGPGRIDHEFTTVPAKNLVALQGEYFNNISMQGNPTLVRTDAELNFHWTLFGPDPKLGNDFYAVRWIGKLLSPATGEFRIGLEGNDGFRLYINGALLIDNWSKQSYRASLADYSFQKDSVYDIKVEFFEPAGNATIRLIWNMEKPDDWKEKIDAAVQMAKTSDLVIMTAGIEEGEFRDRAMLSLPGHQEEMILRLAATGKPVIVLLSGGGAITMSKWIDKVTAILDIWYPGEQGGDAVADILFGDYNPSGRLPITFPLSEAQLPLVYNHKPTGRGDDYDNLSGLPLFPFGFGLSYTDFEYSDVKTSRQALKRNDSCIISFILKNAGNRAGDEVVQLYIRDLLASVARPVMELKGFQRVHLEAGESKEIRFAIGASLLSMLDINLKRVVEPGEFSIMLGSSSRDLRLKQTIKVLP